MSEPANNGSPSPVSLVLEIGEKTPVLKSITFQEEGQSPLSLPIQRNGKTPKAIATVLTLFRAHLDCVFFRITSKKEDEHLIKVVVGAVREVQNNPAARAGNKGEIYSFAGSKFLKLFLVPSDDADFSYVELDFKRLKPSAVTIIRNNLEVKEVADLKKLAEQLAATGSWELAGDYDLEASSPPSSTAVELSQARATVTADNAATTTNNWPTIVLTTRKDTPQWTNYRELDLDGGRLLGITCVIESASPYFRFGFKLLARQGRLFGDGSIQSQDANRVVHIGRNNSDRPGLSTQDIFLTHYMNGIRGDLDKRLFTVKEVVTASLELSIDQDYLCQVKVNGSCQCQYSQIIPPEICHRVVMLAWGDHDEYSVEVKNLVVNTTRML